MRLQLSGQEFDFKNCTATIKLCTLKNNEIEITPVKINDVLIEEVIDTSSEKGSHSTGISNNEGIESENNDTITSRSHQKVLTEIEKKQ